VHVEHRHRGIDGGDFFANPLQHVAGVAVGPDVQHHLTSTGAGLQERHVNERFGQSAGIRVA
jgi:hypothetical protein